MPVKVKKLHNWVRLEKSENFEKAEIKYTRALIKYKTWEFIISPKSWVTPEWEYEIEVYCKRFGKSESFYLSKPEWSLWYIAPKTARNMEDAINLVRDFINNELQ